jgi:hypothetical protein
VQRADESGADHAPRWWRTRDGTIDLDAITFDRPFKRPVRAAGRHWHARDRWRAEGSPVACPEAPARTTVRPVADVRSLPRPSCVGCYYADIAARTADSACVPSSELTRATQHGSVDTPCAWAALSRVWTSPWPPLGLSGDEAQGCLFAEARRKAGDRRVGAGTRTSAYALRGARLAAGERRAGLAWRDASPIKRGDANGRRSNLQTIASAWRSMLALQGQLQRGRSASAARRSPPIRCRRELVDLVLAAYLSAVGRLDEAEAAIRQGHRN